MTWLDGGNAQNIRIGVGFQPGDPPVDTIQEIKVPGLACFAAFVFLEVFGATVAGSAVPPSKLWIAFQIRLTVALRSLNFFTGVRPGMPFQTSTSLLAVHLAARSDSSCWLAKISPSKSDCWLSRAVMLFSASIRNVVICFSFVPPVAVMTSITLVGKESNSILRPGGKILTHGD